METNDHDYLVGVGEELYKAWQDEMLYGRGVLSLSDGKLKHIPASVVVEHGHLSTSAEEGTDG